MIRVDIICVEDHHCAGLGSRVGARALFCFEIMLLGIDVLIHGSVLRGFRPSFGRWAGVVVLGNTAGTQFRQCTTSILGAPDLKVPVWMCRQEVPSLSLMTKGPSAIGVKGPVFDFGFLT